MGKLSSESISLSAPSPPSTICVIGMPAASTPSPGTAVAVASGFVVLGTSGIWDSSEVLSHGVPLPFCALCLNLLLFTTGTCWELPEGDDCLEECLGWVLGLDSGWVLSVDS